MTTYAIISKLAMDVDNAIRELDQCRRDIGCQTEKIKTLEDNEEKRKQRYQEQGAELGRIQGEIYRLEKYVESKDNSIADSCRRISDIYKPCANEPTLNCQIAVLKTYIDKKDQKIQSLEETISSLDKRFEEDAHLTANTLKQKDIAIEALQETIKKYKRLRKE